MHDTRTPLKISIGMVAANVLLNLVLVWTPLKTGTFGLTAAFTTAISVILMALLLRKKLGGRLGLRAMLLGIAKTAIATAVMAIAVTVVLRYGHDWWADWCSSLRSKRFSVFAERLLDVAAPMTVGILAFLATTWALRSSELRELIGSKR